MIIVVIGLILLFIQTTINTLSAILITGLLFVTIGCFRIISFFIQNRSTNDSEVIVQKDIEEIIPPQVSKFKSKQRLISEVKKCERCGETYPKDTLHQTCIICGEPL